MKRMVSLVLVATMMLGFCTNTSAQTQSQVKNDLYTDVFFITSKPSNDRADTITRFDWQTSYARFLTDRLAVGPIFGIFKPNDDEANGYVGALVRYHFADTFGRVIPFVEVNGSRSVNYQDLTDVEVRAGVILPMGRTGGRFRIAPYYYKGFYEGDDTFQSFGISWGVGLAF